MQILHLFKDFKMKRKAVVFTGAGMSAPSGISTFRSTDGLWQKYKIEDVATPQAWGKDPGFVLKFYNDRRAQLDEVEPNAGHFAVKELESCYEVVVVTQNVDNLHERAGSEAVIHLHGELTKARSTKNQQTILDIGTRPLALGDCCEQGGQLRPHIVWFGEQPHFIDEAIYHLETADLLIVAGTSLQVYPAAGLIHYVPPRAEKYLVDLNGGLQVAGFTVKTGSVDKVLPELVKELC